MGKDCFIARSDIFTDKLLGTGHLDTGGRFKRKSEFHNSNCCLCRSGTLCYRSSHFNGVNDKKRALAGIDNFDGMSVGRASPTGNDVELDR
jgi:hypothetical protein